MHGQQCRDIGMASNDVINSQSLYRLEELEKALIYGRAYTGTSENLVGSGGPFNRGDRNSEVRSEGASANTLFITDTFDGLTDVGEKVSVLWVGVGQPTISVTGSSNTINGGTTAIPISTQYQGVVITKVAADTYVVSGAI